MVDDHGHVLVVAADIVAAWCGDPIRKPGIRTSPLETPADMLFPLEHVHEATSAFCVGLIVGDEFIPGTGSGIAAVPRHPRGLTDRGVPVHLLESLVDDRKPVGAPGMNGRCDDSPEAQAGERRVSQLTVNGQ